ncbi:MAG: hypothetical protein KF910_08540 [Brevundimonas sp.]|uniref:hypothetical protein n=1 Tax=Brevundimonas sp. TaxID=1871086 RepID=UPI0025B806DA|nr:hypothetical protein [Brevundimonas sp.]MBX3477642.1 hypothetical protein [Brevundimonas sp.]
MGRAIGRGVGVAAVFALIGPLVGTTLVLLVLAAALMMTNPANGILTVLMWPFAAVLGMMIGFIPALATGVVMAALSHRLKTRLAWIGASAACGMATTALVHRLADLGESLMVTVVCGGGAATVCALLSLGWRPRRRAY